MFSLLLLLLLLLPLLLQVVLRMLAAMFDVADALGALQQACSIKVAAVSGSWDWTLVQMTRAWGDVMMGVVGLADVMLAHVTQLSEETAAALLTKASGLRLLLLT
jgi:signal transduction histidine kinase